MDDPVLHQIYIDRLNSHAAQHDEFFYDDPGKLMPDVYWPDFNAWHHRRREEILNKFIQRRYWSDTLDSFPHNLRSLTEGPRVMTGTGRDVFLHDIAASLLWGMYGNRQFRGTMMLLWMSESTARLLERREMYVRIAWLLPEVDMTLAAHARILQLDGLLTERTGTFNFFDSTFPSSALGGPLALEDPYQEEPHYWNNSSDASGALQRTDSGVNMDGPTGHHPTSQDPLVQAIDPGTQFSIATQKEADLSITANRSGSTPPCLSDAKEWTATVLEPCSEPAPHTACQEGSRKQSTSIHQCEPSDSSVCQAIQRGLDALSGIGLKAFEETDSRSSSLLSLESMYSAAPHRRLKRKTSRYQEFFKTLNGVQSSQSHPENEASCDTLQLSAEKTRPDSEIPVVRATRTPSVGSLRSTRAVHGSASDIEVPDRSERIGTRTPRQGPLKNKKIISAGQGQGRSQREAQRRPALADSNPNAVKIAEATLNSWIEGTWKRQTGAIAIRHSHARVHV